MSKSPDLRKYIEDVIADCVATVLSKCRFEDFLLNLDLCFVRTAMRLVDSHGTLCNASLIKYVEFVKNGGAEKIRKRVKAALRPPQEIAQILDILFQNNDVEEMWLKANADVWAKSYFIDRLAGVLSVTLEFRTIYGQMILKKIDF
jgi:hypothetical protein